MDSRRIRRRAEKAQAREAHAQKHTKELKALLQLLKALPIALPALPAVPVAEEQRAADPLAAEVEVALEAAAAALKTTTPYRSLPKDYGPPEGLEVLRAMIDRPAKYQEKMLGQELSILAKVWALAGEAEGEDAGGLAIVDIGAGNGSLALLAAVLLDAHAVLIDHTLPPPPLRVEDKVPEPYRSRILRVNGDVAELEATRDLEPLLERHGVKRAIVIAKHLCGVGTDLALRFVERWKHRREPGSETAKEVTVVGAIFATCCGHKIGKDDRIIYADLHYKDQYLVPLTGGDKIKLLELLAAGTRCVAWRTTASSLENRILPAQVRAAELFEDALQQPRLNMLQALFPAATEVAFTDASKSPQNRCLIAGAASALERLQDNGQCTPSFLVALQAAAARLSAVCGGILDLKPHGFASKKYDYDGI